MKTKRLKIVYARQRGIARALLFMNALLWVVITIVTSIDMVANSNGLPTVLAAFFLLFNATVMFLFGRTLDSWDKPVYGIALVAVLLNAVLAFTGLPDPLYMSALILDILILLSLLSLQKYYFQ